MPTVLRFAGVRVMIYFNDHRPAHVHVLGPDRESVFNLNCPAGPMEIRENYGFSRRDIAQIQSFLAEHVQELCRKWKEFHGTT